MGEARRAATAIAMTLELSEVASGSLSVIVTELATNLARYAVKGTIVLRGLREEGDNGVEVLALDCGPGIPNLSRAMADGYSTGGTNGQGLGAVRRMSHQFDVMSSDLGTALVARVWSKGTSVSAFPDGLEHGAVCTPLHEGDPSGDGWTVVRRRSGTIAVIVDGLGHGYDAAIAADTALRIIRDEPEGTPMELMESAHRALRSTRGAAMAIAEISLASRQVRFVGVGNVSALVVSASTVKHLVSSNGTVGHSQIRPRNFICDFPDGACLLMHSDGINTRWKLEAYPGLAMRHPSLIAAVLHRDFSRARDDSTSLALREFSAFS